MNKYPPHTITSKLDFHLWWLTALLIALNVGLFIWQITTGVDASQPSITDAIAWGADYAPLTFLEEPTRLFSSMFFHFGFIHLALNMWALYLFGQIAEQMFGRWFFFALYLLSGLMGGLLSGFVDLQHTFSMLQAAEINYEYLPKVGAGASGAVMGLGAALTIISLLPPLTNQRFLLDKKTLVMIMGINLLIGFMTTGINNTAHIGGMLMGTLLALVWYISSKYQSLLYQLIGLVLATILCIIFYLYCLTVLDIVQPLWRELLTAMQERFNF